MKQTTMKARITTLAAICAAFTTAPAQTIVDDFNGANIDATKWTTAASGTGSVSQSGGFLNVTDGGGITSVAQYPVGLTIEGKFKITDNYDALRIVIRTDGTFAGQYHEAANGVGIKFVSSQHIDRWNEVSIQNPNYSAPWGIELRTPLNLGTLYDFKIVDTGTVVSVYLTDLVNPILSTSTTERGGNTFSVYNRFAFGRTSYVDSLSVTATPEPTSAALLTLGVASLIGLRRRTKV